MKYVFVLIAALALSGGAVMQHAYGVEKGPNGGPQEDIAGVDAELLVSGNTITFNIFDEDAKTVPTKGFVGSVLVVSGADRETLTLTPFGENSLKGDAKKPIAPGAAITLTLKTAAGKSGQARFKH
jgi:hypothetical protein